MPQPFFKPSVSTGSAGFSLIEAMVVVSISAILLAVGVPNFTAFVNDSRVSSSANEFIAAMTLARTEAVKRGTLVSICRSSNANNASPSCDTGSNNWNAGWIVFVENSTANQVGTFEAGETIVARQSGLGEKVNASGNLASITYNSLGTPTGGALDAQFNFNYDLKRPRQICINRNGRVKVIQGASDASAC